MNNFGRRDHPARQLVSNGYRNRFLPKLDDLRQYLKPGRDRPEPGPGIHLFPSNAGVRAPVDEEHIPSRVVGGGLAPNLQDNPAVHEALSQQAAAAGMVPHDDSARLEAIISHSNSPPLE